MILINALDMHCQCESIVRDDDDDADPSDSAPSNSADKPRSKDTKMFNFASQAAGAVVLAKSPSTAKGFHNLLNDDRDKYGICACDEKKWVVIGLSEDILVASVEVANYEKYSSMLKDFQILASNTYPTSEWIDLGTYTAEAHLGPQLFSISRHTDAHTRYLKFKFLTHYLNEALCTLSQIKVFGMTVIASFKQEVERSDNQMRDMLSSLNRELELGDAADDESMVPLNLPPEVRLDVTPTIEGAGAGSSPTSVELTVSSSGDDDNGSPPPVIAQPIPYIPSADSDTDASLHGSTIVAGIADQTIFIEGGGTRLDPGIGSVTPDQVIDGLEQWEPAEDHTHTHDAGISGTGDHTEAAELLGGEEVTILITPTGPAEASESEPVSGEPRTTPSASSAGGAADHDDCCCSQEKSHQVDDLRIAPISSQLDDENDTVPERDPAPALELSTCCHSEGAIDDRTVDSSADEASPDEAATDAVVHTEVVVTPPMDAVVVVPVEGSTSDGPTHAAVNTDQSDVVTGDGDGYESTRHSEPMAVVAAADLTATGVGTDGKSGSGFEFAQKMKSLLPPLPFYELSGIFSSVTSSGTHTTVTEEERDKVVSEAISDPTEVLCSSDSTSSIQLSIEPSIAAAAATTPLIHDGHRIAIQRLGALESQDASSLNLIKVFVEKNIPIIPTAVSSVAVAVNSLEVIASEVKGNCTVSIDRVAPSSSSHNSSSSAASVSTSNSSNNSSATTYGLNCMEHLSFAEFQKKMLSKLQQKSTSTGHGLDVAQDSSSSSRDSNVFRSLMQKIKGLEMNQAIVEMYIVQVSYCLCSEILQNNS